MSEDSTLSHTAWDCGGDLDNTIRETIINDVFLHQPDMNETNMDENTGTEEGYQTKTNKKRRLGSPLETHQSTETYPTNSDNQKLILIVKGTTTNITEKNQLKLKKFFLEFEPTLKENNLKLHKDYITVALQKQEQVEKLCSIQTILGSEVTITEHKANKNITTTKKIIFGVSVTWTDEEIRNESGANEIYRMNKYNTETNTKEPTTTIILTYNIPNPPASIYIGLKQYKTRQYIPKPLRCFNCQLFGHSMQNCKGKVTCGRCTENHKTDSCPIPRFEENSANNILLYKCRNCNQHHPSGFKGCAAFIKAQTITEIKTTNKISYAEAINKFKQTSSTNNTTQQPIIHTANPTNMHSLTSQNSQRALQSITTEATNSNPSTPRRPPLQMNVSTPFTSRPILENSSQRTERVNQVTTNFNLNYPPISLTTEQTTINLLVTLLKVIINILEQSSIKNTNLESLITKLANLIPIHDL